MGKITLEAPGDINQMTERKVKEEKEKKTRDFERKSNFKNK
ncbi:hypothetical protein SDC9_115438 [bioreactor metagenome]|uniref:Uncharacterized protein n=1 Tax=bioreactor metagenome TaxID=1076179 RepID=A0A645BT53_9ZZZZ